MKKDTIRTLLEESIVRRQPVALYREGLDAPPLYCVPLLSSDRLALVALYTDFQPDGYEVVRLRDISALRGDERTAFHARIMAQEEVLPRLVAPPVPLRDFAALLSALQEQCEPVIVEDGGKTFLLGTIEKAGKNKLRVRYIGTDGQIDPKITRIRYEDIASVHFGGRYLQLVARYAEAADADKDADRADEVDGVEEAGGVDETDGAYEADTPAITDVPAMTQPLAKKKPAKRETAAKSNASKPEPKPKREPKTRSAASKRAAKPKSGAPAAPTL